MMLIFRLFLISFPYVLLPWGCFASVYFAISHAKFLFRFEAKTNKTKPFLCFKATKIRFIFAYFCFEPKTNGQP